MKEIIERITNTADGIEVVLTEGLDETVNATFRDTDADQSLTTAYFQTIAEARTWAHATLFENAGGGSVLIF
jgi:hypothetical protein